MGLGTNLGTRLGSEPAAPSLIHAPSCPASAGHEGDEWGWEEQSLPQLGVMGLGAHLGSRSSPNDPGVTRRLLKAPFMWSPYVRCTRGRGSTALSPAVTPINLIFKFFFTGVI